MNHVTTGLVLATGMFAGAGTTVGERSVVIGDHGDVDSGVDAKDTAIKPATMTEPPRNNGHTWRRETVSRVKPRTRAASSILRHSGGGYNNRVG